MAPQAYFNPSHLNILPSTVAFPNTPLDNRILRYSDSIGNLPTKCRASSRRVKILEFWYLPYPRHKIHIHLIALLRP